MRDCGGPANVAQSRSEASFVENLGHEIGDADRNFETAGQQRSASGPTPPTSESGENVNTASTQKGSPVVVGRILDTIEPARQLKSNEPRIPTLSQSSNCTCKR
jgi:hypothetical protein